MYFWQADQLCKPKRTEIKGEKDEQRFQLQLLKTATEEAHCFAVSVVKEEQPTEIQQVLRALPSVFDEPKGLPPMREGHNHPIVLQKGTNPISLKPH